VRRPAVPIVLLVALAVALAAAGAMLAGSTLLGYATNRHDPVGKLVPALTTTTQAPPIAATVRGEPDD
jgi:hypothetical protein